MGRLWDLIEGHRDAQQYPPSYRQLAIKLGVSQSLFVTWKAPKSLPSRESIESIARVVGVSYQTVLDAALEDTRYRIPPSEDLEERDGDDRDAAPMKRAAESAATEAAPAGTPAPADGPSATSAGDDGAPAAKPKRTRTVPARPAHGRDRSGAPGAASTRRRGTSS